MTEDNDKVMVELELPKDQVSVHPTDGENSEVSSDKPEQEPLKEELESTKQQLEKVKKERNELREKTEKTNAEDESLVKQVTGYEAGELVSAPLHPPEAEAKKRPARGQIHNLFVGFALMPLALIALLVFNWQVGVAVALVGAAFIALGVLVRI